MLRATVIYGKSRTSCRHIQPLLSVTDFVCDLHALLSQSLIGTISVMRMKQIENSYELGLGVWQQATFDWQRRRSKVPFSALSVCLLWDRCWSRAEVYTKKDWKPFGVILSLTTMFFIGFLKNVFVFFIETIICLNLYFFFQFKILINFYINLCEAAPMQTD